MPFTQPKRLQSPPEEVAGASVLVVDDEVVWRTILRTDLELLGYSKELIAIWNKKNQEFCAAVEQRRSKPAT